MNSKRKGQDWQKDYMDLHSMYTDAQRAIAELRDRLDVMTQCADNYSRMFEESAEECDTLRQQLAEAQSNTDKWCDVACSQRDEADRLAAQRDKLREECERIGRDYQIARDAHDSLLIEHDALRQQRDKLAGLLREALDIKEAWYLKDRIDAALAEVGK